MKWIKKTWLIPLLFMFVILVVGSLYMVSLLTKEEKLSKDEIRSQLEQMYEGTVASIKLKKDVYIVEMTRVGANYVIEADAIHGNILSLRQLSEMKDERPKVLSEEEVKEIIRKEYEDEIERITLDHEADPPVYEVEAVKDQVLVKVMIDALSGEIISAEPQGTTAPHGLISREQAIKIAFTQLTGDVEYVEFKQTEDGGFYLIEIEQDNDDGNDLEAVIQIHAITGEILSVIWDD